MIIAASSVLRSPLIVNKKEPLQTASEIRSTKMTYNNLDQLDKNILHEIANDARKPFLEVARKCNVSGAAIHQRIQRLFKFGVLKGSQFILSPEAIGYETCAFVGIFLKDPSDFDRVIDQLSKIPEVTECHYTTGNYDMFIKIYARKVICFNHIQIHFFKSINVLSACPWANSCLTAERHNNLAA